MPSTDSNSRVLYPIADIKEGSRIRSDYGDLSDLAESIATHGLIHPIVINTSGTLIAGGRRFRAMRDVLKWKEVPITYFEFADEATLRILEREENVRRKAMTWKEECLSIVEVHNHHQVQAALSRQPKWTQKATGELLNQSEASVSYALQLADHIRRGDKEIIACDRAWDAIQLLAKRRIDATNAIVAKMTLPSGDVLAKANAVLNSNLDTSDAALFSAPASVGGVGSLADDGELPGAPTSQSPVTIPLSKMLLHGDAVSLLSSMPDACIDHCITDWPYGIDMDMLQQSNTGMDVSSTSAEHDVQSNEALQAAIVPHIYRILKPNSFFITWGDYMQWQRTYDLCVAAGFRVQRWPLIWSKTSRCMNQAADVNFTKDTECAIVCRKGNATLVNKQATSVWSGANDAEAKALGHPFAKPYGLWSWLYSAVCLRGQTVLDPFAGRGSSTIAALSFGLSPIACELNTDHFNGLVVNVSEWYKKNLKNVSFS